VFFYGVYLLTSIGLNITSNTTYYPITTAIGAGLNIGLNFALIPRFGIIGAAWANGAAYAVQAGLAFAFSQRFYPIRYESGRVSRALAAAVIAFVMATAIPAMPALAGLLVRGTTVVVVMTALLWITRFFNADEIRALEALWIRRDTRLATAPVEATGLAGEIVSVEVPEEPGGRLEHNA